jgi:hypothetical protein
VQNPPPQNDDLLEDLENVASIAIVSIEGATLVSSRRDGIDRAWKIDTKLAGQDAPETVRAPGVEDLILPRKPPHRQQQARVGGRRSVRWRGSIGA